MHKPVLLNEVIKYLDLKTGDIVLDATINGGGHSEEIIKRIMPGGLLVGIDQDKEILHVLNSKSEFRNSKLVNGNFRDLDELLKAKGINRLDAALFDLGMSSFHLEKSGRGFSFQKDEPLIMNYKINLGPEDLTAEKILNEWSEKEIFEILELYGEEKRAKEIAKKIVDFRKENSFKTTFDLVSVIGGKRNHIHPATKTFQALRIAVNDELNALAEGLSKVWELLNNNGRLVVISFHSLEDRIVKTFFSTQKGEILTKKPVGPSAGEKELNPRSRSAKLRVIKKIK